MTLFWTLLVVSALVAAFDQVARFPRRFKDHIRFPEWLYFWDAEFTFPWPIDWPVDAGHTYQGLKIWLITLAWFLAPEMPWYWYAIYMLIWWMILRNLFLHRIITNDPNWPAVKVDQETN